MGHPVYAFFYRCDIYYACVCLCSNKEFIYLSICIGLYIHIYIYKCIHSRNIPKMSTRKQEEKDLGRKEGFMLYH